MSRRTSLGAERIVAAAVSVADEEGVASVTMRRVAKELGVEAMSLYHHLPNKEAILNGIVDAVFAELGDAPEETGTGDDWRTALETRSWSLRRAISRHSWVLGLIESRHYVGLSRLRHDNAVLGVLLRGGFAPLEAVQAISILDSYVYGSVLQQQQQDLESSGGAEQAASGFLGELAAEEFPHLGAVARVVSAGGAPTHDEVFGRGLQLILDGLRPS